MAQVTYYNEFVVVPGTTEPQGPVLGVNNSRKFLQVANNGASGVVRIKFDQNFDVPANQVWTIAFTATPTGGNWTVTDWTGAVSASLAYNESASALATALSAMAGFTAVGGVTVTGTMAAGFVITAANQVTASTLANNGAITGQSTLTNNIAQQIEIQNVVFSATPTAGTFELQDSLGNNTAALAYNASNSAIQTALNALPAINGGVSAVNFTGNTIAITYGNSPLAYTNVPPIVVVNNTLTNNAVLTNNVQTLYMEPTPLQGTFCLMFGGQQSAPLQAVGITAAKLQTAFTAMSSVGAGNCVVSGFSFASGFSFTFIGALGNSPQPTIQILSGPDSEYGAVNGGTSHLHADINPSFGIQKHVANDVDVQVYQTVPGVGPAPVTSTVTTTQQGAAPAAVAVQVGVSVSGQLPVPGQAQVTDGIQILAGQNQTYSDGGTPAVPLGAMYIIASQAGISVQINEG